jgi:hypothetical protein
MAFKKRILLECSPFLAAIFIFFMYLQPHTSLRHLIPGAFATRPSGLFVIDKSARSLGPECWGGCLTIAEREIAYEQPFPSLPVPCGFFTPSGLDDVAAHFATRFDCENVLYTVITNNYDQLVKATEFVYSGVKLKVCAVALMDRTTYQAQLKSGTAKGWEVFNIDPLPFVNTERTAHVMKTMQSTLFPRADLVVYVDGKINLPSLNLTSFPSQSLVMPAHYDANRNTLREFSAAIKRLGERNRTWLASDLEDIEHQRAQYKREGAFERLQAPLMADCCFIVYRKGDPCIDLALCAWRNEMTHFSQRAQLSLFYVLDRLNVTNRVALTWKPYTRAHAAAFKGASI